MVCANQNKESLKNNKCWDFPAGLVVKAPHLNCKGTWVRSVVMELTSHILQGTAKIHKEKR